MEICEKCGEVHKKCRGHKKRKNSPDGKLHPCNKSPMPNGCCDVHGGKSLVGVAHPSFRTGRYSKALPTRLLEKFETGISDEHLLELRDEISLVDVHLRERLEKLYSGESDKMWLTLKIQFQNLLEITRFLNLREGNQSNDFDEWADIIIEDKQGQSDKNREKNKRERERLNLATPELIRLQNESLKQLGETIEKGLESFYIFEQIQPIIEQRRKLVESETKRQKDLEQSITLEKALAIIALLSDIVKRYVTDRDQLAAISAELANAANK